MEISLPTDCGNSPRVALVGEFAVSWAAGDSVAMDEWLADDARWMLVGAAPHSGSNPAPQPPFEPHYVEILSAVTHGKFASCDGYLTRGDSRVDFCHMFRFSGAAKTARIVEIRTYLVASAAKESSSAQGS